MCLSSLVTDTSPRWVINTVTYNSPLASQKNTPQCCTLLLTVPKTVNMDSQGPA